MLSKLKQWVTVVLKGRWQIQRMGRRISYLRNTVQTQQEQLERLRVQWNTMHTRTTEELEITARTIKAQQEQIDQLQSLNQVMEEYTIPALTAANRHIVSVFDEQISITERRRGLIERTAVDAM